MELGPGASEEGEEGKSPDEKKNRCLITRYLPSCTGRFFR